MANFFYNNFREGCLNGSFNLTTNIYVVLATNSYVPDIDNDVYRAALTGTELVSGTNAGIVALSSPNVQQDNTGERGVLYGTAILWTPITASSIGYAVLFSSTASGAASDPLIMAVDLGTDSATGNFWSVTAGTFNVAWNASGILAVT